MNAKIKVLEPYIPPTKAERKAKAKRKAERDATFDKFMRKLSMETFQDTLQQSIRDLLPEIMAREKHIPDFNRLSVPTAEQVEFEQYMRGNTFS